MKLKVGDIYYDTKIGEHYIFQIYDIDLVYARLMPLIRNGRVYDHHAPYFLSIENTDSFIKIPLRNKIYSTFYLNYRECSE